MKRHESRGHLKIMPTTEKKYSKQKELGIRTRPKLKYSNLQCLQISPEW